MKDFCKDLKALAVRCNPCNENSYGACQVKIGLQPYYAGEFEVWDTVTILRQGDTLAVHTDIEVTYQTKFPGGAHAGKMHEFALEENEKRAALTKELANRLPKGIEMLEPHLHYTPDKHAPERVALHIHVFKRVTSLGEAARAAKQLVEIIKPREIEKALV